MPDFLISNGDTMPKFARIDSNKIAFVEQEKATGYPSPKAAEDAFSSALASMWLIAAQKGKDALSKGTIAMIKSSDMRGFRNHAAKDDTWYVKAIHLEAAKSQYGGMQHVKKHPTDFFVTEWMKDAKASKTPLTDRFPVSSRANHDDLLGVRSAFYLVNQQGWLGRQEKKQAQGLLKFGTGFEMAVSFGSAEAAKAQLKQMGDPDAWIVRSSCVFVDARPSHPRCGPVDLASSIQSACEARDISQAIDDCAQERIKDMEALKTKQGPAAAPRKRNRL